MTLLLIIAAAVFTLVAAYQLVAPFLSSREELLRFEVLDEDLRRVEELAARKSTLLQTLRDIEFDYETQKITESDYRELKRRYERDAVEVMRELDSLHGGRGWEQTIDEELALRLQKLERTRPERAQAQPQARASQPAVAPSLIRCPECDKEMEVDARFCSQCGTTLADSEFAGSDLESSSKTVDESDSAESDGQPPLESRSLPTSGSEVAT